MRDCFLALIAALTISGPVYSQQAAPSTSSNLSEILARMESGEFHAREAAFNEFMTRVGSESGSVSFFLDRHPDQADRIKLALFHQLAYENYLFIEDTNPPRDGYTEDDTEHYAELIGVVSSLYDERSIPALVGAMTTGGIAGRGVMQYGDKALPAVLEKLKSPNALVRASALGMTLAILEKRTDPASHARVLSLIRKSLGDKDPVVRTQAIWEIGCLTDRQDFVPTLQEIAKTDPWNLPGQKADDGGDGDEFYPVRADARRVLRDIHNNEGCNHSSSQGPSHKN